MTIEDGLTVLIGMLFGIVGGCNVAAVLLSKSYGIGEKWWRICGSAVALVVCVVLIWEGVK